MKQAIILAAGEGKRLRPFTVSKPKVMLSVAGKPILGYVIEALTRNGIRNIVLIVGYQREQILDYFGSGEDYGARLTYVTQEKQLGTAHALLQAKPITEDEFLVLSGDNLITAETISRFIKAKPPAVLVKKSENPGRYGVVTLQVGRVREIIEKPKEAESNLVSTGIYAFTQKIFEFIGSELDIPDGLNRMIKEGSPLRAVETMGTWLDIVYPWDLLGLNSAILSRLSGNIGGTLEKNVVIKPPVVIGHNSVIHPNTIISGPVVIGENCEIGPNVVISPSTSVGNNVSIKPFCHIDNSVIASDVRIGSGTIIQDSVIDKGSEIKSRFTAVVDETEVKVDDEHHRVKIGAMLGEGCSIGSGVVAQSGVILGNYGRVGALKLISGHFPDRSLII
ncbi:MAG: bifunctional sugar-1-phosphate nucleotidylyltransferase/acetyltransferase [Chloroflexota bacterium]